MGRPQVTAGGLPWLGLGYEPAATLPVLSPWVWRLLQLRVCAAGGESSTSLVCHHTHKELDSAGESLSGIHCCVQQDPLVSSDRNSIQNCLRRTWRLFRLGVGEAPGRLQVWLDLGA